MDKKTDHANILAKQIAAQMVANEGTSPWWGLSYEDGGVGWSRVSLKITKNMLNGYDMVHGGMVFGLADSAFAYACNSRNLRTVAQQASISFLSSAYAGEKLVAEAREEAVQGRSGVYNVTVTGEDGRIVATFQGLSRTIRGQIIEEER